MQTPAAAGGHSIHRPLARLSIGLTSLLGEVHVPEDEVVDRLRAALSGRGLPLAHF
jgi:hypothetical protein